MLGQPRELVILNPAQRGEGSRGSTNARRSCNHAPRRVSRRIDADFHNGEEYYQLQGSQLWLPPSADDRPRRELLEWHTETVFRG